MDGGPDRHPRKTQREEETMSARQQREETVPALQEVPRPKRKPKEHVEMLPPENEIQVAEPGSIRETVNQQRLRKHLELEEEYNEIKRRYLISKHQIEDLIQRGATIQQGNYKPDYGVRLRRHPRYKQALIDAKGDAYQQRILNGTAPHAYFRVRIY